MRERGRDGGTKCVRACVLAAAALFSWASLVPVLLGKKSDSTTLGPFRPSAELLNGRAAMLGFASLITVEAIKHTALF